VEAVSTPEEARLAAQGAPDSRASADAYHEREQRLNADIQAMQQGPVVHLAGLTDFHQGAPSVEQQQASHGQRAPALPDVGGHGSADDRIA
jgi:hypothetical protein